MITLNGHQVTPTLFPDKTSQVWKLPERILNYKENKIFWEFENEAELFHLAQLCQLLDNYRGEKHLYVPYMPYGRQDKEVGNGACFARSTFLSILLTLGLDSITTIDAHSETPGVNSLYPSAAISQAVVGTKATHVCFPDSGAEKRYKVELPCIILGKDRDQATGEIRGLKHMLSFDPPARWGRILIVDDICDGGRTFIEAAKLLHSLAPQAEVSLYVSHGIFSKGTRVLRDAGIKHIFTKNGEV